MKKITLIPVILITLFLLSGAVNAQEIVNADLDGDGCPDEIDYSPSVTNPDRIYVLYDEDNFADVAEFWQEEYQDTCEVELIEAADVSVFMDAWNTLGRVDGKYMYNIDTVILLYHGFDGYMIFRDSNVLTTEWLSDVYYSYTIDDLGPIMMDTLRLNICEAGTLERTSLDGEYNLAVGFLTGPFDIGHVVSSDGTYNFTCEPDIFDERSISAVRGEEEQLVSYSLEGGKIVWEWVEPVCRIRN